jgi:hypothetical protein
MGEFGCYNCLDRLTETLVAQEQDYRLSCPIHDEYIFRYTEKCAVELICFVGNLKMKARRKGGKKRYVINNYSMEGKRNVDFLQLCVSVSI